MADAYNENGSFEWELEKARSNAIKHRMTFEEAMSVFADPLSVAVPDPDHSDFEERWVILGFSDRHHLLVVVYTERQNGLRLISARAANPDEKRKYEGITNMDIEHKGVTEAQEPEMRDHYDFTGGERGKYAHLFPQKAHIVVLSPDLATAFPNSDSVNEALRSLVKIARQSVALEPVQEPESPAATPPGASPSA